MRTTQDRFIMLAGPTAVGKTELSLTLAETLKAEIVSADSRQVYRELTIGTAKPTKEELQRVRHHFVDERSLGEPYSAGQFQSEATHRISEIVARGRRPIIVGGSTLYLHALKHGLADVPPIPPEVRAAVQDRLERLGASRLHGELSEFDPDLARRIDPSKTRRLTRAVEVYEATGRSLSSFYKEQRPPPYSFHLFVLTRERADLFARIDRRVHDMFAGGLLDEVHDVIRSGFEPSLESLQTIGYQEPLAYFRGALSYDEMVRRIKRNTRRYAKRQLTWFRRERDAVWVGADRPLPLLVAHILERTHHA